MHTVDWWLTGIGVEDAELDRDVDVEEIYPISNILFSTAIMLRTLHVMFPGRINTLGH